MRFPLAALLFVERFEDRIASDCYQRRHPDSSSQVGGSFLGQAVVLADIVPRLKRSRIDPGKGDEFLGIGPETPDPER